MIYLLLFYEFFKIGLFSVGGGLATIPFLKELSGKYNWYTLSELADMIALSESTPGPIGINMATYAGYSAGGTLGGIIAPLSLVFPSVIVIFIISHFLTRFSESRYVKGAFYGLLPASSALVTSAAASLLILSVCIDGKVQILHILIYLTFTFVSFFAEFKKSLHPIFIIIIGGIIGFFFGEYLI